MTHGKPRTSVPFYRDVRTLALIAQLAFLAAVAAGLLLLFANLNRGLEAQRLNTSFDFLTRSAGFLIAEGPAFQPEESYLKAFAVGLYNTARVASLAIVLATVLGVVMGIARLSSSWLVNRLSLVYVEVIRNTPLLVQLVFWYFAVILQLPDVREAIKLGPDVYLSQRGLALPWLVPTENIGAFRPWLLAATAAAALTWGFLARRRARTGQFRAAGPAALGVLVALVALGLAAAPNPLEVTRPELGTFRMSGGVSLSPEFAALLVSLTVYFGAFIAEVVRAGIQAVPAGQWEAARSLGLGYLQSLRLIVLPQALGVILPPLGNQYLNLVKGSSLAVAIGYPDLFNVSNTIGVQSGYSVQAMLMVLGMYLALSLAIAGVMNLVRRGAVRSAR